MRYASKYNHIITVEPGKRGGKPCIRGMRITAGDIPGWLGTGRTPEEIIDDFPELTLTDIQAALLFAADRDNNTLMLVA